MLAGDFFKHKGAPVRRSGHCDAFAHSQIIFADRHGGTRFRGHETLTLAPGANNGNNAGGVAGRPVNVSELTRDERTDVDTPFTSFYATGNATSRIRLTANFARFAADGDTDGLDDVTGSLASFALGRFFTGISEESSSRAKNTTWRGGARADVTLTDKVDLTAGYRREHRELDGSALIRTLYRQSVTFGGADPRDLEVILNAKNALEREEDVVDAIAGADARPDLCFAPFLQFTDMMGIGNEGARHADHVG